jgi:anti-sigma B factor antagonist
MSIELHIGTLGEARSLVRVAGEVDLATAPDLAAALDGALAERRPIVIDLSDVEFIDTSGVRVLLDARRHVTEQGIELTVVAPPGSPARRILDLTDLSEALSVVDAADHIPVDGA